MAIGAEAGLWRDAFHVLRKNPVFLVSASLIAIFSLMAIVPQAFIWFYPGTHDVDACSLSLSSNTGGGRPSSEAWFGYDIQGCDYYLRTIYGARASLAIGTLVTGGALFIALVSLLAVGFFSSALYVKQFWVLLAAAPALHALAERDGSLRHIVLFRNHGRRAGTSLTHPHSQIIATPVVAPETRRRIAADATASGHAQLAAEQAAADYINAVYGYHQAVASL